MVPHNTPTLTLHHLSPADRRRWMALEKQRQTQEFQDSCAKAAACLLLAGFLVAVSVWASQ